MESDKIEILLEKYFEGESSTAEESQLRAYFSAPGVAPQFAQYIPLFAYFSAAGQQTAPQPVAITAVPVKRSSRMTWLSIAASAVILLGVGMIAFLNYDANRAEQLGTYDDPEIAFRETQKALSLLSRNVNKGVESVQYIQEYENAKDKIFMPTQNNH